MRSPHLLVMLTAAACGGSPPAAPDATPLPDAAPVATVLFLQFEGQAVTPGPEAPWNNQSSVLHAPATIPAFAAGDPDRATKIAAVAGEVRSILAPYDIDVVTTRPASGTYEMVIAGGAPSDIGLPADTGALGVGTCHMTGDHIDYVFETTDGGQHDMSAAIISMLAYGHGVSYSLDAGDCMCVPAGNTACGHLTQACTIGGASTHVDTAHSCVGTDTMDEAQLFRLVFGAHP